MSQILRRPSAAPPPVPASCLKYVAHWRCYLLMQGSFTDSHPTLVKITDTLRFCNNRKLFYKIFDLHRDYWLIQFRPSGIESFQQREGDSPRGCRREGWTPVDRLPYGKCVGKFK